MKQPSVSIVTPSFNQGRYIERTIKSVLSQNISELEYLIYDGGSADNTIDVLRSFGDMIQWISENDNGQSDAVNKGFKKATGEIIGWLNSDDVYCPDALNSVIDVFKYHNNVDVVYGMADHINESDEIIEAYYTQEWDYEKLKNVCYMCQPAVFFRRSIIDEFGLLNEQLHYCMDYEYWLRIGKNKPFYYIKKKLAGSRLYPETKTLGSKVAVHEEILSMFKHTFGYIPSKWIYNYAHAIVNDMGLKRELPEDNLRYVKKLIQICIMSFLKNKYYIPFTDAKIMSSWYFSAIKQFGVTSENEDRI